MKRLPRAFAILPALVPGLVTAMTAMPAAASAATDAHNAKASILRNDGACGESKPLKDIGFVNFHRVRNTVRLNVHLKGADPHASYNVFLFENAPTSCHLIDGNLGTISTNGAGVGNGNFKIGVPPGATTFFADPTVEPDPFTFPSNDTTTVTLP